MACGEVEGGLENSSNSGGPSRPSSSSNNAATSSSSIIDINNFLIWRAPPSKSYVNGLEEIILSPFEISRDLITQGQYKAVMGVNPSKGTKNDNSPVDGVTWFKAMEFCETLSRLTGLDIKLPTEAQWEYTACSDSEISGCPLLPTIQRNYAYWEWTKDCYDSKYPYELTNPSGPPDCLPIYPKVRKGFNKPFIVNKDNNPRLSLDPYADIIGYDPISFRVVRIGRGF
jgi:formylglycine-generating enzyme required for sulfatase activity